jgi:hypothetical protein
VAAVYRYWSAFVFVAVIIQVGLAGYGGFYVAHKVDKGIVNKDRFEDGFGIHAAVGYLVVLSGIILLVIALAPSDRRARARKPGLLVGLLVLQVVLAWFGWVVPVIGFFHPVNALAIFALSGMIAHAAWRGESGDVPAPTAA